MIIWVHLVGNNLVVGVFCIIPPWVYPPCASSVFVHRMAPQGMRRVWLVAETTMPEKGGGINCSNFIKWRWLEIPVLNSLNRPGKFPWAPMKTSKIACRLGSLAQLELLSHIPLEKRRRAEPLWMSSLTMLGHCKRWTDMKLAICWFDTHLAAIHLASPLPAKQAAG